MFQKKIYRLSYLIKKYCTDYYSFISGILLLFPKFVSDKTYIKIQYRAALKKFPDLNNPETFTEKLQWLKLYDHNPKYTTIVDKVKVKEYVKSIIGEQYIIPTLFVWERVEDIDFEKLPRQFVLKCNHYGGGSVFICKNKETFNIKKVKKSLDKQMRTDLYLRSREWPYKNVERKIFCEKYMEDKSGDIRDYKIYCFDGEPKMMLVASNRYTTHNFSYFDMDFNPVQIESTEGKSCYDDIEKPVNFEEMKEVAKKLSKGFVHVRVDLYSINGQIYFGELTLYDASGFDDMNSDFWNKKFGSWLNLSSIKI